MMLIERNVENIKFEISASNVFFKNKKKPSPETDAESRPENTP